MDRRPRVQFLEASSDKAIVDSTVAQPAQTIFSGLSTAAQYAHLHAKTPLARQQNDAACDAVSVMHAPGQSNYRWYEIKPWPRDLTPKMIRTYIWKLSNKKAMGTEIGKLVSPFSGESELVAVSLFDAVLAELVRDRLTDPGWKIDREQKTALCDVNEYRQEEIIRAVEEWRSERRNVDRRKKEQASVRMFMPSSVLRR